MTFDFKEGEQFLLMENMSKVIPQLSH